MAVASPSPPGGGGSSSSGGGGSGGGVATVGAEETGPDAGTAFRKKFGALIWSVGVDLRMDVVTVATAALYFQRFFLVERQGAFDAARVAMACVWLAAKVREASPRLRDVVNAFLALGGRGGEGEVLQMEAYWALRDEVVLLEQAVLRAMAFDTEPTQAYSHLTELAWLLLGCGPAESNGLCCLAWSLLNDAFCSEVCAVCPAARVATACILLAVQLAQRVPELKSDADRAAGRLDSLGREPHLEDFLGLGRRSGGGAAEVAEICRDLLAVYEVDRRWNGQQPSRRGDRSPSSEDL